MIRNTLKSLWAHKRRLVSTVVAIVLGVAFMAGTLVLTSTINKIFDDLFSNVNENTDAVVRGEVFAKGQQTGTQRSLLDESLLADVERVPGVAAAVPVVVNFNQTLLDAEGDAMGGQGPPTFVASWTDDPELNAYKIVQGRSPQKSGEAVIDRSTANEGDYQVGDKLTLLGPDGRTRPEVVGIARFGEADSAGGTIFVGTTLEQAQVYSGQPDKVNQIDIRADDGIEPEQLVSRLDDADLGDEVDVVTGREAADEQANEIKDAFAFFSTILLVFAAVALFVGMFIISNTFSILVAQRTKELALLRAIGAGRGQVLLSVLVEAAIVGLVAATLGFLAGVGLAAAAFAGLRSAGLDLPSAGLAIEPSTAVTAIVVGLLVTAAAALIPAIRATRVPPIAALRDVALDRSSRSVPRTVLGLLLAILGVLSIRPAFEPDPPSSDLPGIGIGLGLILLAVLVLGPVICRPIARLVGAPLPSVKGITGLLSRENAIRNPRRTASTASALIIGVTLVGFITVFASTAQTSITKSVSAGFDGDFIIRPANFGAQPTGLPPKVSSDLGGIDGVEQVASVQATLAHTSLARGRTADGYVAGIDPEAYQQVFNVEMQEGRFGPLAADEVVIDKLLARDKGVRVGDRITVRSFADRTASFEVVGIGEDLAIVSFFGLPVVTSTEGFAKLEPQPADFIVGVDLAGGTSVDSARPDLKSALKPYPTMSLQDRDQFTGSLIAQVKALLNVIYALLAVSIIIALIGIANTLSLSIHERTRELGLLRAMGMTRSQLKSTVRWEAVIVALMGTGIGLVLGLALSWVLVKGLASQGIDTFSVPTTGLVLEVVFGAGLGILAAVRPARRAAKLNVLEAIAHE